MNIKFIIFTLVCALTVANASAQKVVGDVLPDEKIIAALEKLPMANEKDTIVTKLLVSSIDSTVHLSSFKKGRTLVTAQGFGGKEFVEIQTVIGFTPSQKKVLDWIEGMRQKANFLCKVEFDDIILPNQKRIAYSWGSKEYVSRAVPPGEGDNCTYKIYGLDCSGFIYQLLKLNGIHIPVKKAYAEQERKPDFLKQYLKEGFFGDIAFDVVDKGKLEFKDMQSGDIIYFKNSAGRATHIAIIFVTDDGTISLYQSLGSPNRSKTKFSNCDRNLDMNHGVYTRTLNASIRSQNYGCVRVVPL